MKVLKTVTLLISVTMLLGIVMPVFAEDLGCPVNVPEGSVLVINVKYDVINEEDASMGSWYWALTHYTVDLKVWQLPDGSWVARKTYKGIFEVPEGAHSPVAGVEQARAGYGNLHSCYTASFTGTLDPKTFPDVTGDLPLKTKGYLGTVDYGSSFETIIASYPSGDPNANPGYWSWLSGYFSGVGSFVYIDDVWTYTLRDDGSATARKLIEIGIYVFQQGGPLYTVTGDIIT